jgi:hypothetical protein
LLVAPRLNLVAREPRGVEDEHDVEPALGGVRHEPLEMRACLGLAPARVKVAVLIGQFEVVLVGEATDTLALGIWGEALALLLG